MPSSFNPHPAFGPDATSRYSLSPSTLLSFNPHPAFGPDATRRLVSIGHCFWLFQSSPGLWAGCNTPWATECVWISCFNPHPAFGPDATSPGRRRLPSRVGFNPHPAFGPDATSLTSGSPQRPQSCFNPHPAFGPDATREVLTTLARYCSFNPHPAFGPDATPVAGFSMCSLRTSLAGLPNDHCSCSFFKISSYGPGMSANLLSGHAPA